MKIISVCGISKSGKTTTIEQVIRGLRERGHRVGSVKEIHNERFAIDPNPTSNTHRHRAAGAELVCARGLYETDLLFPEKLSISQILHFYQGYDFVVLEGVTDGVFPTIVTAHTEEDLALKWSDRVVCVSGRIVSVLKKSQGVPVINLFAEYSGDPDIDSVTAYRGVPAIDALTDCDRLLDLIETKACDYCPETLISQVKTSAPPVENRASPVENTASSVVALASQANEQTRRLFSRRNTVQVRQMPVIEKTCASPEHAALEADFLWLLGDLQVRVPRVLAVDACTLRLSYIPGETLPDFLSRMEASPDPTEIQAAASALVDWLAAFYAAVSHDTTGEIRGDVNGRNFLWDGRMLWGVDFEEHVYGSKEEDVGRLLAYVETYRSAKQEIPALFAQHIRRLAVTKLSLSQADIDAFRAQELRDMAVRRTKK